MNIIFIAQTVIDLYSIDSTKWSVFNESINLILYYL